MRCSLCRVDCIEKLTLFFLLGAPKEITIQEKTIESRGKNTKGETKKSNRTVKKAAMFKICNQKYCVHYGLLGPGCGATLNSGSMEDKHAKLVKEGGAVTKVKSGVYPTNKQARIHFTKANKPKSSFEEDKSERNRSYSGSSTGSGGGGGGGGGGGSGGGEKKRKQVMAPISMSGIGRAKPRSKSSSNSVGTTTTTTTTSGSGSTGVSSDSLYTEVNGAIVKTYRDPKIQQIRSIVGMGPTDARVEELLSASLGNVSAAVSMYYETGGLKTTSASSSNWETVSTNKTTTTSSSSTTTASLPGNGRSNSSGEPTAAAAAECVIYMLGGGLESYCEQVAEAIIVKARVQAQISYRSGKCSFFDFYS